MTLRTVTQTDSAVATDQTRLLANAVALLHANALVGDAGITIGGTTSKVRSTSTAAYTIDGRFYSKAATDDLWTLSGTTIPVSSANKYLLCLTTTGTAVCIPGVPASTLDDVVVPGPTQGVCGVGVVYVETNSSTTFVPGTTALNAAGLTVTYLDGFERSLLPLASQTASVEGSDTSTTEPVYALSSASPDDAEQGATDVDVTLIGAGFTNGDDAVFSNAGITVNSTTFVSATELTANIDVDIGATVGAGTVKVNGINGDTNTVPFTVEATTAWYQNPDLYPGAFLYDEMAYAGADDAAKTTALRANISSNITGGTGGGGSLYIDGVRADLAFIDSTVPFFGTPAMRYDQPELTNATAELWPNIPSTRRLRQMWFRQAMRYSTGYTTQGTSPGGQGYKIYGWGWRGYESRGSLEWGNVDDRYITWSNTDKIDPFPSRGATADLIGSTSAGTEWSAPSWYWDYVLVEQTADNTCRTRWWHFPADGSSAPVLLADNGSQSPTMNAGYTISLIRNIQCGMNFNSTRDAGQNQAVYRSKWEVVDGEEYPDAYGILAATGGSIVTLPAIGSFALTSTDTSTVEQGATGVTITLTGTGLVQGDVLYNTGVIFSATGIDITAFRVASPTSIVLTIDVDPAATLGAGTIKLHSSALNQDSSTVAFTVTAPPASNNARDFSGTAQYAAKTDPTGVLANAAWTIGAWVNVDTYGGDGRGIVKIGPQGSLARGVHFLVKSTGVLRVRSDAQDFVEGVTAIGTGSWVRVGATKLAAGVSHMRVFLNGSQDASVNMDTPIEITTGDIFGAADQNTTDGVGYFDGKMAWVFYLAGVALSAAAIDGYLQDPQSLVDDYGPSGTVTANALKILWPMQCDDGGTETDESGVPNNGTYSGSPTFSSGTGPSPSTPWDPCA